MCDHMGMSSYLIYTLILEYWNKQELFIGERNVLRLKLPNQVFKVFLMLLSNKKINQAAKQTTSAEANCWFRESFNQMQDAETSMT